MSSDVNDSIILFKSVAESENEDNYWKTFRSAHFQVILIPVLDFEFVNLKELSIKLKNPQDYEGIFASFGNDNAVGMGIIFTSPRCVTGVEISLENDDSASVLEKWEKHTHFVVGEKTAQMVENLNFVAQGKEAGNAKNLAKIILKGNYSKPFLYPKGSLTKDDFMSSLRENQVKVDDILIYKTKPHPELEKSIVQLKSSLTKGTAYFVYFSPSGVNFSLPILQKHEFDLNQTKFVAIGPTTEGILKEKGLKVSASSAKPEPQALLDAILTCKKTER